MAQLSEEERIDADDRQDIAAVLEQSTFKTTLPSYAVKLLSIMIENKCREHSFPCKK